MTIDVNPNTVTAPIADVAQETPPAIVVPDTTRLVDMAPDLPAAGNDDVLTRTEVAEADASVAPIAVTEADAAASAVM